MIPEALAGLDLTGIHPAAYQALLGEIKERRLDKVTQEWVQLFVLRWMERNKNNIAA